MPLRSMTGFGRGEAAGLDHAWVAEVRTVNHRFLDQKISLPRSFHPFEEAVKKRAAACLTRGRVEVALTLVGDQVATPQLTINTELAAAHHRCLVQLCETFGIAEGPRLQDMLSARDLLRYEEQGPDLDAEWAIASQALENALANCDQMRQVEGKSLKQDLTARLAAFQALVEHIRQQAPLLLEQRQSELRSRIERLLQGIDLDPLRLAQEAAILADKSDISEEITRLCSHIEQFERFLDEEEPVGRRLDFLLQEFLREVNTLCSKINNAEVARLGVEMKNEIEKLREQVQNVE